ncbi:MAG: hypothetical protein BMS9Abin12_1346 [Acidimicrobiia bacterium]|nr:MAG: hypothetical protein BMS9Abin12_1346 [Acidimicrobiia bacterium]
MSDDRKNDQSGGGFDDWLDDEPGPVTDPYASLASDDPQEAADDRMELSDQVSGEESEEPKARIDQSADEEVEDDETSEMERVESDGEAEEDETFEIEVVESGDESSAELEDDETSEIDTASAVDDSESDDGELDDTGELEVVTPQGVAVPEDGSDVAEALDEDADTEGLQRVSGVGFASLWRKDKSDSIESTSTGTSPELFDMSKEDYLDTATKEHESLAELMALADNEDTAQVALAAPIPGLDSTVVGFEDVVEAEGHGRVHARPSGDLLARIITGVGLVVALGASLLWRPALVAFALGIFVLGAGEFYTALVRSGRKPIALFGFIGIIGASLGAFFFDALWIPVAFLLVTTVLLLFYAVVPGKLDPIGNLGLTITVMVWAGLGSFAMLIAKPDAYRTLIFGVVVTVAAMDIAQYFFGRALGRHQLAPWVSPKKTVEGLIAGVIVALTIGALLDFFKPFELTSGLAIGAAVAVFAPIGDLAMSAAKRSLGLKDMGSVLPGHGGFLDRIDGLLFVIPVAWIIFLWAGIL